MLQQKERASETQTINQNVNINGCDGKQQKQQIYRNNITPQKHVTHYVRQRPPPKPYKPAQKPTQKPLKQVKHSSAIKHNSRYKKPAKNAETMESIDGVDNNDEVNVEQVNEEEPMDIDPPEMYQNNVGQPDVEMTENLPASVTINDGYEVHKVYDKGTDVVIKKKNKRPRQRTKTPVKKVRVQPPKESTSKIVESVETTDEHDDLIIPTKPIVRMISPLKIKPTKRKNPDMYDDDDEAIATKKMRVGVEFLPEKEATKRNQMKRDHEEMIEDKTTSAKRLRMNDGYTTFIDIPEG